MKKHTVILAAAATLALGFSTASFAFEKSDDDVPKNNHATAGNTIQSEEAAAASIPLYDGSSSDDDWLSLSNYERQMIRANE